MFNAILDPIFTPLLSFGIFYAIVIFAFLLSLMITLIYKFTTDQHQMKYYKEKIKKYQEEMKAAKDDTEKVMKIQKKAMAVNMEYMKLSMRPTLFTFIPIIIIFGWMSSTFAYLPLEADVPFTITAQIDKQYSQDLSITADGLSILSDHTVTPQNGYATWELEGPDGVYTADISATSEIKQVQIIIGEQKHIPQADYRYSDGVIKDINIGFEKVKPMQDVPILKDIPWIGNFGWLGTYILFSIIFSMSIRKLMKIH